MAATTRASFGKLGGRPDRDSGNGGNHIKRPRPIYANATATFYKDHHVAKMGSGGSSGGRGGGGTKPSDKRSCYYCKVSKEKYLKHII